MQRFISRDPAGYIDGWNLYRDYFSPRMMDPEGLTSRDDIADYRFTYTCACGWVDNGHVHNARYYTRNIMWQLKSESGIKSTHKDRKGTFKVMGRMSQSLGGTKIKTIERLSFWVKPKLSDETRKSVALDIFYRLGVAFENAQGDLRGGLNATGSSFSSEDLTSNHLGFYGEILNHGTKKIYKTCETLNKKQSEDIWDEGGTIKDKVYPTWVKHHPTPVPYVATPTQNASCCAECRTWPKVYDTIPRKGYNKTHGKWIAVGKAMPRELAHRFDEIESRNGYCDPYEERRKKILEYRDKEVLPRDWPAHIKDEKMWN